MSHSTTDHDPEHCRDDKGIEILSDEIIESRICTEPSPLLYLHEKEIAWHESESIHDPISIDMDGSERECDHISVKRINVGGGYYPPLYFIQKDYPIFVFPIYGCNTAGILIDPSAFWLFSIIAIIMRPSANAVASFIWTNSLSPFFLFTLILRRRAW